MTDLPRLLDAFDAAQASEENKRRIAVQRSLVQLEPVLAFNAWDLTRGFPSVLLPWFERLGRSLDLDDIGRQTGPLPRALAESIIEFQLLQKLAKFEHTPDDTPLSPAVNTNLGLCHLYRPGPFGERFQVDPASGAYVAPPILDAPQDLSALSTPVYQCDPALHEERISTFREVCGDRLVILDDALPSRIAAPFGVANNLRGGLNLLMDFRTAPDFAHRLMRTITDAILSYNQQALEAEERLRFIPKGMGDYSDDFITPWAFHRGLLSMTNLGSDEVSCDMFSAEEYREFIWPYECAVAAASEHVYYHSCGNLTPIFELVAELPNLRRLHSSPWSGLPAAVRAAGGNVVLEVHLSPNLDLEGLADEALADEVWRIAEQAAMGLPMEVVAPVHIQGGRRFKDALLRACHGTVAGPGAS